MFEATRPSAKRVPLGPSALTPMHKTHTRIHTYRHTHTNKYMYVHVHRQIHTYTPPGPGVPGRQLPGVPPACAQPGVAPPAAAPGCNVSTYTDRQTERQTERQSDTHTRTHTHTNKRVRSYTHLHTHTHTHIHRTPFLQLFFLNHTQNVFHTSGCPSACTCPPRSRPAARHALTRRT